ncbi:unnamed protein product [Hymenolepis diminuta]|uniref:Uncharacterized protein n=1 Tax=Hymenolepis diminuta TaxID=6216 RepID=A0A3P6XTU2_HYMDI|nr:unnamed protein product [Hymenolepis diminuta]
MPVVIASKITRRRYFAGVEATASSEGQRPIEVKTEFFQWCSLWFSQPLLNKYPEALQVSQNGGSQARPTSNVEFVAVMTADCMDAN